MKVLGIIGLVVGIVALLMGAYLQFSIVPAAGVAETADELASSLGDLYYGSPAELINRRDMEAKTEFGEYTLLVGGVAFLLSIVPAIKKQKTALFGVIFGFVALALGAAYGTHMFS